MDLILKRDKKWTQDTTGRLFESLGAERRFICFILEDRIRDKKVYGSTAIPAGRYEIVLTYSPKFGRELPRLLKVPNFEGILIHPGNDQGDTEGCLLPGLQRHEMSDGTQRVTESRKAFDFLNECIQKAVALGQRVWISIE